MEGIVEPRPQDFETWEDFEQAMDFYKWQKEEMEKVEEDYTEE